MAKIPAARAAAMAKEVESGELRVESEATAGLSATPNPSLSTLHSQLSTPNPGQAKVVTTTSGLYPRKLPSKDGARIKEMPSGTVVTVLRVEGGWAQVRWDVRPGLHHTGWCSIGENGVDYLVFGGDGQ